MNYLHHTLRNLFHKAFGLSLIAALVFGASIRNASADYETWLGNSDNVWNDEGTAGNASAENWSGRYGNNEVPFPYDSAIFSQSSANMSLVLSAPTEPNNIVFENAGSGYTIGAPGSTNGLTFQDYSGFFIESTLVGHGGGDTINAPITGQGRLLIGNFSPTTAEPTLASEGVAGYNNTLTVAGPITLNNNAYLAGDGKIVLSGNIASPTHSGGLQIDMVGAGSVVVSGTNTFTGNSAFGGNVTLDYTTNNTSKFNSSATLDLGYQYTNYNGNVPASGGDVTILANQSSATTVTSATTRINGSSSVFVEGGTASAPTTVNFGNLYQATYAASLDISTTGTVSLQTTSGNSDNILLGEDVTINKTYFARNDGAGNIVALTSDDGSAFNTSYKNYTVAASNTDVQTLVGGSEGANSIRFANAADGTDATSAHTLDLGTGTLSMDFGTILVGADVTGNTAITNGTINDGRTLSIINFSSGVLNIGANINDGSISFNGGTVKLSGNNTVSNPGFSYLNSGTVILGSDNGIGKDEQLSFGTSNSTLALNGHNITVSRLLSNPDGIPGNAAAAAGLNANITNTVAGTISTITIESASNEGGAADGTDLYGFNNAGIYTGGLNESSGAIISLNIQGTSFGPAYFILGSSNPLSYDVTNSNTANSTLAEGTNTLFTGSITVGLTGALAYTGYGYVETTGAFDLNGLFGISGQQANGLAVTYLTGTGAVVGGYSAGSGTFFIDEVGSASDTFAGTFGTASYGANTSLYLGGTGQLVLPNSIYASYVTTTGTSTLVAPGQYGNSGINVTGESTFIVDGTGGQELGGDQLILFGGTLKVAPTGSGADVVVTGADNRYYNQMQISGDAQLILDRGANNSLTVELGSTSSSDWGQFNAYTNYFQGLSIGSAQGLAALGNTDKFIILVGPGDGTNNNPAGTLNNVYIAAVTDGIVLPMTVGVNDSVGSKQDATFLTYNGTGATTDQGFTAYTFANGTVNNIAGSTYNSVEQMTDTEALAQDTQAYAVEMDKGASLNLNGHTLGLGGPTNQSGLILNGASITGTGVVNFNSFINNVYTDLDNGSISNLNVFGRVLAKDGPGTLFVSDMISGGFLEINQGALNLANGVPTNSNTEIVLAGGVIETNGSLTNSLGNTGGDIYFLSGVSGGGFSAQGGVLSVSLNNGAGLVWGSDAGGTSGFLTQNEVLNFGSRTSDNIVFFLNDLNLGISTGGNAGETAVYSRVIDVTANIADAGKDPFDPTVKDGTIIEGIISSGNAYLGLAKTGTGTLFLYPEDINGNPSANTYTGATTIAQGTLAIASDGALGTAPTAAYALNTSPGTTGAALTPGAIEISGGATLAVFNGSTFGASLAPHVVLNSNRQILLASGTTGATPSIINVEGDPVYGYAELDFGGVIADYVDEVGSLQKQGAGLFNYSGTSANTGIDSVAAGTFKVSGSGSVNSVSGIVLNNATSTSHAEFNYSSSTGLARSVTFAAAANGSFGGGTFSYNSSAAYTGGALNVINHGVLSGSGNLGTTAVTIGATGTITPGQIDPTPGTLTQGATTFLTGGNYNFLVANATGAAGTGYSTVVATSLDISSLGSFTINLESLNGSAPGNAANFDPTQSYSFVLVDATGGITGAFDPSQFAVMTAANNGATGFANTFTGTWSVSESGNDLLLDYTGVAAPEPSTYALMGLGFLALVAVNHWRRRNA